MKKIANLIASFMAFGTLCAQQPPAPNQPPSLTPMPAPLSEIQPSSPPLPETQAKPPVAPVAPKPAPASGGMTIDFAGTKPAQAPPRSGADSIAGFKLKDYPVNDLFQYLARTAGKQYFANPDLTMSITGQMKEGNPIERMQEVAFQYGITLYQKGDTIYAIPSDAVAALPKKQAEFVLRYLRPDRARLQELITPFLTAGSGTIDFEDKTNTVIVHDNDPAIARVADFLTRVDRPQRQITIQVRVFRVSTDAVNRVGVDWSQTLGEKGLNIQAVASGALTSAFGLDIATNIANSVLNSNVASQLIDVGSTSSSTYTSSDTDNRAATGNVALGPTAINVVLRALYGNTNVEEESNPTIVTEDNEEATIENINKIPIVTSTTDTSSAGATTSSEVRYRIDPDDPFEVGVKLTVRPTILPGNKIRLAVAPSVGSIRGWVDAASGNPALPNRYPDVVLSRMKNIATIPNGYTLLFGGFSRVTTTRGGNKVPILGDIPIVNFLFKAREDGKVRENLVFMITATATDLGSPEVVVAETERLRRTYLSTPDEHSADEQRVNLTPDANLIGTVQDELTPFPKKIENTNLLSPRNPKNENLGQIKTPQEKAQTTEALSLAPAPAETTEARRRSKPWEYIVPARNNQ